MPSVNDDITKRPVVYYLDGMEQAAVQKDIYYKYTKDCELKMDVYAPPGLRADDRLPAVMFVHSDGAPEILEDIKDWAAFVSWGQLVAASEMVGITFHHRSSQGLSQMHEVANDIFDAIMFVRDNAHLMNVDENRLCLCSFSFGVPYAMSLALRYKWDFLRCSVGYYGYMDLQHMGEHTTTRVLSGTLREYSPIAYLGKDVSGIAPMLLVRAGKDRSAINYSIDAFVRTSIEKNISVEFINHPTGGHGFDTNENDRTSQQIIKRTLAFMQQNLGV